MRLGKSRARITNLEIFHYSVFAIAVGTFVLLAKGIRFDALLMLLLGVIAFAASVQLER